MARVKRGVAAKRRHKKVLEQAKGYYGNKSRSYRAANEHWELYALAEKLVDLEDSFRTWRFRHVTTVERIIGRKRGTGGTSGVDYLMTGLERWCFPELWSLRTKL